MSSYRVYFSEKDSLNLQGRQTPQEVNQNVNYQEWIVNKPWGYEYLVYLNSFTEVWHLYLKENGVTSMHSHPNKKTALIVLKGEALFSTLNTTVTLKALDNVIIDPGVFHSTRSISNAGTILIEVESPPFKYDLIRLEDEYGRKGTFYEGKNQMIQSSDEDIRFTELVQPGFVQKKFHNLSISIKKMNQQYNVEDIQHLKEHDLLVVLEGNVLTKKGHLLYSIADVVKKTNFMVDVESHSIDQLTLFLIKNGNVPAKNLA